MPDSIIQIDTINGKAPHVRHRAVINRVRRPVGDRILNSEVAMTVCARAICNFTNAEKLSLNFADGSVFSKQCSLCYEVQS